MSGPIVMALVALACAGAAATLFFRPARSDAAVYRNRIAVAMLGAAAVILLGFAFALGTILRS